MASYEPIKVVVIHQNEVARAGLMAGFGKYGDLEVIRARWSGVDDNDYGQTAAPGVADVVVADYDAGLAYIEKCRAESRPASAPKVLIVTPSDSESDIRHALGRGARGYMLIDSDFDDLARGVREVHMGVRALSRRIAQQLAESVLTDNLSCREIEVLALVVQGLGNKLIARRLGIAVGTVKSHLKSIFEKLDVQSRTQAIAVTARRGLLSQPQPVHAQLSP
jgi:DNA-binding NarL/FixJ family response regulator